MQRVTLVQRGERLLVPRHSDFDRLHLVLMSTIPFLFPHRDLPLVGTYRHNLRDGVLA